MEFISSLTLVLAIIGCVTGIGSLLIQFSSYLSTRSLLKVKIDDLSFSYFFKSNDFKVSGYKTNYSAVISLVITNNSSYPVTIHEISIKDMGFKHKILHSNDLKFVAKGMPISKDSTIIYEPSDSLKLPLRIMAFDTFYGSVRIPFFDLLINNENLKSPVNFTLLISTPRKTHSCKVSLYEYEYHHALHQEDHKK